MSQAMKIPLLIGGRPRFMLNKQGPLVPLGVGEWSISGSQTSSLVSIEGNSDDTSLFYPLGSTPIKLQGPIWVRVKIDEIGDEEYIDIYAERVNGT